MTFTFKLERLDGTPAEPASIKTMILSWQPGDTIPLDAKRTLQVVRIRGARCRGYATSVHQLIPSSQAPELFWEPSNLVAACGRCNYGGGARVAAENTRRTIESLRTLVVEQQQQIAEMAERLARCEHLKRSAIY